MCAGIVGMKSCCLLAVSLMFCLLVPPSAAVAGIGDWKNYTDMKSVRSIAAEGTRLWAATSGGVFRFDPADSSYRKFVNSDGLTTNDATAIFIDASGRVWIGQQNGIIDVYDPAAQRWRTITDIAVSTKTNRAINAFLQRGEALYIATAFGVTVFSPDKFEFTDTYTGFAGGILQPNVTAVHSFQNRLFLATASGIIVSNPGAVNLADPASWSVDPSGATTVNAFAEFNGSLYASSASGLLRYGSGAWSTANSVTASIRIIAATDTGLIFTEGTLLRSLNAGGSVSLLSSAVPSGITCGTVTSDKRIALGVTAGGIGMLSSGGTWQQYYPNGPHSNSFYKMVVDDLGDLWSASGGHTGGSGFYRFDGARWTNYNTSNTPLLLNNDCYQIAVGPNNSKWVSTWGEGAVLVNNAGRVVRRYDYDYPGFIGVNRSGSTGIPSYTVPSRAAVDRSGNVWLSGVFSNDRSKVLWKMKPDSTWESFPGLPAPHDYAFMYDMVIDRNDTKWFTNSLISRQESPVVAYHNDQRAIGGIVNSWGLLYESDGLSDDRINAVAIDRDGDIWLGTGVGITVINEPANPAQRISKVYDFSVRDLFINAIAVDALNNKWIGTSRGVFVLSPDGTQLLHHYSVETTGGRLVDNMVFSLAIDGKKGIVYIGTEKGLSTLEIAAVSVKNTMAAIDLSPNPVYLPNQSTVEIRGLSEDCTIKVLALNGAVVSQFPAQGGGRAFWDCRDGEGKSVASGVYIIVAHTKAGDQIASSKIAVIRQ